LDSRQQEKRINPLRARTRVGIGGEKEMTLNRGPLIKSLRQAKKESPDDVDQERMGAHSGIRPGRKTRT